MTKLYYSLETGDADFRAEMEAAVYPEGFAGFNRERVIFAYEHQMLVWPWWGPSRGSAVTDAWFSSGIGSVPAGGIKMRGLYEIVAFGIDNWLEQVVKPNIAAWAANRQVEGYFGQGSAAEFTGHIALDFETWNLYSFETGSGAYNYFKAATGTSGAAARSMWEKLVVALYSIIMAELRRVFPKAKFGNPYVTGEYLYQLDDSPGAPGAVVVETGQTIKTALQYQARGPVAGYSSPSLHGGLAGWLLQIFKMFDYVDAELYAKIGYSTPNGGSAEIEGSSELTGEDTSPLGFVAFSQDSGHVIPDGPTIVTTGKVSADIAVEDEGPEILTDTITSVARRDAAYYYRLHCEEMRRIAAAAQRPLRLWLNPKYAVFNQGDLLPRTGLNDIDAEMMVEEMKSVGANLALWSSSSIGGVDEIDNQGFRDGMRQLNPFLRRLYSL